MATRSTGTEVATLESYAIATRAQELSDVLRENLGGGRTTAFDLERVKVPAGGGKAWTVQTLDGEQDVRELTGVIVAWREPRAFWETAIDQGGGGNPPDCSSDDGRIGQGMYGIGSELHPDGRCETCPMSQWGTKRDSAGNETRGQACKQMRLIFLLQPEALLPTALFCPPTSIGNMRKYFMRLTTQGIPYYGVTTSLALEQDTNPAGIAYSKVMPTLAGRLSPDERAIVRDYAASLQQALDAVTLEARDVSDDDAA